MGRTSFSTLQQLPQHRAAPQPHKAATLQKCHLGRGYIRVAAEMASSSKSAKARILVLHTPDAPELKVLDKLPEGATVLGVGRTLKDLQGLGLSEEDWKSVNVLLNCGSPVKRNLEEIWPHLPNLAWLHSLTAGVEHILFPALVDGPVTLTNAKGNFSHSLAEYTLAACNWFAKDFHRLRAQQKAKKWEPFNVEELRNKTMGIVGYGDIGQACARIARAFGMKIIAMRRSEKLSPEEEQAGLKVYTPDKLNDLMADSDYVVMALPYTESTHHLVNAEAVNSMRSHGVLINVGRGKTLDQDAVVKALQEKRIRGAALDVFETEPLPKESPLYELDNCLLSPHCADRTASFWFEAVEQFMQNLERYVKGEELFNVVDKKRGY
ncbi:g1265 [Coccomyxa viridis]|uniref:G1265 protein n=1 Tax=Coccomyxa viridis TaxID=1274662 RepID=A0ABP1FLE0_9CHLO